MSLGEAARRAESGGWDKTVVGRLRPDPGPDLQSLHTNLVKQNAPLAHLSAGGRSESPYSDEDQFTGYMIWERRSRRTQSKSEYLMYEAGQRYMRCRTCGYRSANEGDLRRADKVVGELPDMLEGACPECNARAQSEMRIPQLGEGDLHRIDGEELRNEILAYPQGRLSIIAPYSGDRVPLFDGDWPWKARSYPIMFLSRFRHPFRMFGPSVADLNWWNQIATDMLMRIALERMLNTSPVWLYPLDGLEDARGQRFEGTDENGWAAFYDGDSPPTISMIGGDPGIPAAWSPAYQYARQALTSHTGIADFSMEPGQSRDIPASSVSQQIQQEEVPQAHFRRRYERQRGLFEGVYYDMIRATYPPERVLRLRGKDGKDYLRAMAASDMPNFDFRFDSTPDLKPQDQFAAAATQVLISTIETRPWAVDLVSDVNHFSPSLVRKAQNDFWKYQQQLARAAADAPPAAGQEQKRGTGGQQKPAPDNVAESESPSGMVARLLSGLTPQAAQQG